MKTTKIQNPVIDEWGIIRPGPMAGLWEMIDRGHASRLSAERKLAILTGEDPDLVGRYACQNCAIEVQPGQEECRSCLCRTFEGPFFGENDR